MFFQRSSLAGLLFPATSAVWLPADRSALATLWNISVKLRKHFGSQQATTFLSTSCGGDWQAPDAADHEMFSCFCFFYVNVGGLFQSCRCQVAEQNWWLQPDRNIHRCCSPGGDLFSSAGGLLTGTATGGSTEHPHTPPQRRNITQIISYYRWKIFLPVGNSTEWN